MAASEIFGWIPLLSWFLPWLSPTDRVDVTLFDRFDNKDFGLQSVNLMVHNEHLQFKQAVVRVKTVLTGVRRIMAEWRLTAAVVAIATLTGFLTLSLTLLLLLCLRLNLLPAWL